MQRNIAVAARVPAESATSFTRPNDNASFAAPDEGGRLDFVMTPRYLLSSALSYYKDLAYSKNIYDLLTEDHERVRSLLSKVQMTDEGASELRDKLFAAIKEDLEIHATFEKQVLYPKARSAAALEDVVEGGLEEHSEAEALLGELEAINSSTKEWLGAMQKLGAAVEHHLVDEETKLFPAARKVIDEADAEAMAEEYVKIRRAAG